MIVLDGVAPALAGAGPLGAAVEARSGELGARFEGDDVLLLDGAAAFASVGQIYR